MDYDYEPAVLEGLAGHGLLPLPGTPPQFLRDAVRDLYRYEIKALRDSLLAGRFPKADYANQVIALRRRYWLLSVPLQLWTRRDAGSPGAATPGGQTDIR
jgi:hypothetical protein